MQEQDDVVRKQSAEKLIQGAKSFFFELDELTKTPSSLNRKKFKDIFAEAPEDNQSQNQNVNPYFRKMWLEVVEYIGKRFPLGAELAQGGKETESDRRDALTELAMYMKVTIHANDRASSRVARNAAKASPGMSASDSPRESFLKSLDFLVEESIKALAMDKDNPDKQGLDRLVSAWKDASLSEKATAAAYLSDTLLTIHSPSISSDNKHKKRVRNGVGYIGRKISIGPIGFIEGGILAITRKNIRNKVKDQITPDLVLAPLLAFRPELNKENGLDDYIATAKKLWLKNMPGQKIPSNFNIEDALSAHTKYSDAKAVVIYNGEKHQTGLIMLIAAHHADPSGPDNNEVKNGILIYVKRENLKGLEENERIKVDFGKEGIEIKSSPPSLGGSSRPKVVEEEIKPAIKRSR